MGYPKVVDEFRTLELVLAGKSIARYGDGEFNLVRGGNCISQLGDMKIREELQGILHNEDRQCMIAIPRLDKRGPKYPNWSKLAPIYEPLLKEGKIYYSSFVTRPDSAPWIATKEYFDDLESLWAGKNVTMVYGSERSLSRGFRAMQSAHHIDVVSSPYRDAYKEIDRLEERICGLQSKIVLLMCGPTATCLAVRLAKRGLHAIDLGHVGMFWRAYENPKLKHLLRIDDAADIHT